MGERLKPGLLTTKPGELFLEKLFVEYITVWYRERIINAVQYEKARKEIDLLKNKKKKKNTEVRKYLNKEKSYQRNEYTKQYLYLLDFINPYHAEFIKWNNPPSIYGTFHYHF